MACVRIRHPRRVGAKWDERMKPPLDAAEAMPSKLNAAFQSFA